MWRECHLKKLGYTKWIHCMLNELGEISYKGLYWIFRVLIKNVTCICEKGGGGGNIIYNIDRTLYALWLVKNPCFSRVQNIEKVSFIVFHNWHHPSLYHRANEEAKAANIYVLHLRILKKCTYKTLACGLCFPHFPHVLKCLSCFITA